MKHPALFMVAGLAAFGAGVTVRAEAPARSVPIIYACDKPFIFGFGSWDKAQTAFAAKPDGIHISVKQAQGGAGVAGLDVNLNGYRDWSPAITLAVGEPYIDFAIYPLHNENCFNQTTVPAACYWFYLHTRP